MIDVDSTIVEGQVLTLSQADVCTARDHELTLFHDADAGIWGKYGVITATIAPSGRTLH
jgi:hypothetical protein